MILGEPLAKLDNLIDSISDEKLFTLVFWTRTILSIIAFFLVVSVWDTLPSIAPVADVTTTATVEGRHAVVNYTYKVQKMIDFEVHYELKESSSDILIHDHNIAGRSQKPLSAAPERFQKIFILDRPGYWCLNTSITWNNGLSMRLHSMDLPKTCFNA